MSSSFSVSYPGRSLDNPSLGSRSVHHLSSKSWYTQGTPPTRFESGLEEDYGREVPVRVTQGGPLSIERSLFPSSSSFPLKVSTTNEWVFSDSDLIYDVKLNLFVKTYRLRILRL